jgi:hypothetical protein
MGTDARRYFSLTRMDGGRQGRALVRESVATIGRLAQNQRTVRQAALAGVACLRR